MDKGNITSSAEETTPKTSEDREKLLQNPRDDTENPSDRSGDMPNSTKEGETTSNEVLSTSTTNVDQDKIKGTMFKNVSSENDPSSEDMQLRWDDDDLDEDDCVLDDDAPGLIDSLELSKGDEMTEAIDDELSKPADGDVMPMDVRIGENSGKGVDLEEKLDDKEVNTSKAEESPIEQNKDISNKVMGTCVPDSTLEKDLESANVETTSNIREDIEPDSSEPDTTMGEETINENNATSGAEMTASSSILEDKPVEAPTVLIAEPKESSSSLELKESDSKEESTSTSVVKGEKLKELLMEVDTSEVTEIVPDSKKPVEGTDKEPETLLDIPTDTVTLEVASASQVESKHFDAENTIEMAVEPAKVSEITNEASGITATETDSLIEKSIPKDEDLITSNILLSDAEDDDPVILSAEEENMLLSEPSTDDQLESATMISNVQPDNLGKEVTHPVNDSSEAIKDASDVVKPSTDAPVLMEHDAIETSPELTPNLLLESTTLVYASDTIKANPAASKVHISSGTVQTEPNTEAMVLDVSEDTPKSTDSLDIFPEPTSSADASKPIEAMECDASNPQPQASKDKSDVTLKPTETSSLLDEPLTSTSDLEDAPKSSNELPRASESIQTATEGDSTSKQEIETVEYSETANKLEKVTNDLILLVQQSSSTDAVNNQPANKAIDSHASATVQAVSDASKAVQVADKTEEKATDASNAILKSIVLEPSKSPEDTISEAKVSDASDQIAPNANETATNVPAIIPQALDSPEASTSSESDKQTNSEAKSNDDSNTNQIAPAMIPQAIDIPEASTSSDSDRQINSKKKVSDASNTDQIAPNATAKNAVAIISQAIDSPQPSTSSSSDGDTQNSEAKASDNTDQIAPNASATARNASAIDSPEPSTSSDTATNPLNAPKTIKIASETIQMPCDSTNSPSESSEAPTLVQSAPQLLALLAKPLDDTEDDIPEFTDSLGLLAESSGPLDEEEDPEMEDEDDQDDDEEGEDDQDDESNQPITADQSEDSNAQTSETDAPNATDIEISEDSFADKLGETEMAAVEGAGATETKAKEGGGYMDVDDEFDKLLASHSPHKQKDSSAAEQRKSAEKTEEVTMDVDDAKVADTAEATADEGSASKDILTTDTDRPKGEATPPPPAQAQDKSADTPSKCKKLARSTTVSMNVMNIVELEESSSEDDVQLTTGDDKQETPATEANEDTATDDAAPQNDTAGKPAAAKSVFRLNTDELTIKTGVCAESTLVIPEAKFEDIPTDGPPPAPKFGLEVFSLDSDEEDGSKEREAEKKEASPEKEKPASPKSVPPVHRCSNQHCQGADTVDPPALKYLSKRPSGLCATCDALMDMRLVGLVEGVKDLRPLLELDMDRPDADLVEISDSDSDDGRDDVTKPQVFLGEDGAKLMEEQLADMINDTWRKYKMDDRLAKAEEEVEAQMEQLEKERLAIDSILDDCQAATDALRRELYTAFALPQRQLPPLEICDTIHAQYARIIDETLVQEEPVRRSKRPRVPSREDNQAKRPAIALGFTGDEGKKELVDSSSADASKGDDDNTDIKVVALSAESAPTGLPAHGTLTRPPITVGMTVLAMKHAFGPWLRATVLSAPPRGIQPYSSCKVRFEETPLQKLKPKNPIAAISARHMAYSEPANVRLTIGTRVTSLFSDKRDPRKRRSYYSGVVAEMPNPVNSYRYLVFFDDGYAQYVSHSETHVVCECSPLVWEEVHPFSREFVHQYLRSYPERPMVRLHAGQTIKTEWNGKWWVSRVIQVDASLAEVYFEADNRYEWIYRGSTRLAPLYLELQAAERHRNRPLPRSTQGKKNMPYVEYTRSDEQEAKAAQALQQTEQEIKRQRSVAKKSTVAPVNQHQAPPTPAVAQDAVMSRVVYYTPKAAVKPHKMATHTCSCKCKRTDVLPLKELRTYNPLARPLLSGWERQLVRHRGRKEVMYRAPCGRRVRSLPELHRYLRITHSEMSVDLFDFSPTTHCLAEFVLNRCIVSKKDLSHGKENVPVPCVNYYDTSLPEFCSYNTERTPTAGVPLNLDPDFLCGCDCEDDCQDKTKCNCWKLTLDGARTVGQDGDDVGYVYKRLLDPVPSGIYECNSRCKCKQTCLNRVAQHPLQLKLQVFKTPNRGWGIRALNDVPRGAFLCVYAGNLLTDATANLDGLNEGDEYLAELDYIEVVEGMKEGYEEDIPNRDKESDSRDSKDSEDDTESASSEDERQDARDEDGDFRPMKPITQQLFSKRLRRRDKKDKEKKDKENKEGEGAQPSPGEREKGDCITISDDEEVREPSRFMAQADMGSNEQLSKYRSVRTLYGKDEACYIMDAKVQGNIGRYLNHSCTPNVFVQNVFVDTHDPRFPWVAFFALSHIRAGTELTWNYNYDVGSVPDKVLYCYCGAPNCRGRLL